ncbi:MAG: hypothetical protein K2W99_03130 [Chthoniobacterales bacterium]|nr:hypothetical protein [Chthoniobacterales bacterium]
MNDLTNSSYFKLLTDLLKTINQEEVIEVINKEEGLVEWKVNELMLRLFPHQLSEEEIPEPDALIVEADLLLLDLENRELNHDRFLILHQLNAVSRVRTGIVASITQEGMISINKIIPLANLTQEELLKQLGRVIQAAQDLYQGWNELALQRREKKETLSVAGGTLDQIA